MKKNNFKNGFIDVSLVAIGALIIGLSSLLTLMADSTSTPQKAAKAKILSLDLCSTEGEYTYSCFNQNQNCGAGQGVALIYQCESGKRVQKYPECKSECYVPPSSPPPASNPPSTQATANTITRNGNVGACGKQVFFYYNDGVYAGNACSDSSGNYNYVFEKSTTDWTAHGNGIKDPPTDIRDNPECQIKSSCPGTSGNCAAKGKCEGASGCIDPSNDCYAGPGPNYCGFKCQSNGAWVADSTCPQSQGKPANACGGTAPAEEPAQNGTIPLGGNCDTAEQCANDNNKFKVFCNSHICQKYLLDVEDCQLSNTSNASQTEYHVCKTGSSYGRPTGSQLCCPNSEPDCVTYCAKKQTTTNGCFSIATAQWCSALNKDYQWSNGLCCPKPTPTPIKCGNGVLDPGEACDKNKTSGNWACKGTNETGCKQFCLANGNTLECSDDCSKYINNNLCTDTCGAQPGCHNQKVGVQCDSQCKPLPACPSGCIDGNTYSYIISSLKQNYELNPCGKYCPKTTSAESSTSGTVTLGGHCENTDQCVKDNQYRIECYGTCKKYFADIEDCISSSSKDTLTESHACKSGSSFDKPSGSKLCCPNNESNCDDYCKEKSATTNCTGCISRNDWLRLDLSERDSYSINSNCSPNTYCSKAASSLTVNCGNEVLDSGEICDTKSGFMRNEDDPEHKLGKASYGICNETGVILEKSYVCTGCTGYDLIDVKDSLSRDCRISVATECDKKQSGDSCGEGKTCNSIGQCVSTSQITKDGSICKQKGGTCNNYNYHNDQLYKTYGYMDCPEVVTGHGLAGDIKVKYECTKPLPKDDSECKAKGGTCSNNCKESNIINTDIACPGNSINYCCKPPEAPATNPCYNKVAGNVSVNNKCYYCYGYERSYGFVGNGIVERWGEEVDKSYCDSSQTTLADLPAKVVAKTNCETKYSGAKCQFLAGSDYDSYYDAGLCPHIWDTCVRLKSLRPAVPPEKQCSVVYSGASCKSDCPTAYNIRQPLTNIEDCIDNKLYCCQPKPTKPTNLACGKYTSGICSDNCAPSLSDVASFGSSNSFYSDDPICKTNKFACCRVPKSSTPKEETPQKPASNPVPVSIGLPCPAETECKQNCRNELNISPDPSYASCQIKGTGGTYGQCCVPLKASLDGQIFDETPASQSLNLFEISQVLAAEKKVIPFAQIIITGSNGKTYQTTADQFGKFKIDLPIGITYTVKIVASGYKTVENTVNITDSAKKYTADINLVSAKNTKTNGTINVKETVKPKIITLTSGWNLISLPVNPKTPYTALSMLVEINKQGGKASMIARLQNGSWQVYILDKVGEDFPIEVGKAYFIFNQNDVEVTVTGQDVANISYQLSTGWNSVGFPKKIIPNQTADMTLKLINQEQCTVINGNQCSNKISVSQYLDSLWQSRIKNNNQDYGDNFAIEDGNGYLLKVESPISLTP